MRVLVVEDREENKKAAKEFFDTIEAAEADFAANYSKGLELLQQEKYDLAFIDWEIPRTEGEEPEKLGFDLADEAEKRTIPWVVVTVGKGHRQATGTHVCYFWEKERKPHLLADILKTDSETWKKVYETLMNPFKEKGLQPTYWSLKRINPENPIQVLLTPMGKLAREILAGER